MLEPNPTSRITGAVLVSYGELAMGDLEHALDYVRAVYGADIVVPIPSDTCEVEGYLLSEDLVNHMEDTTIALWTMCDVLGNVDLEDFVNATLRPDISGIDKPILHIAYYSHNDVTMQVYILQGGTY